MREIPPDIYCRVRELSLSMVNATEANDTALHDSLYLQLQAYYDELTRSGSVEPFLTEALADYTDDPVAAVRYYMLSLKQAKRFRDEPVHTKMIALAERLIELGQFERAAAYLRDGRVEAVRWKEHDWVETADALLQECKR